ncbi:hypothetical protein ACLOJK_015500 [Asimina triloba]
MNVHQIAIPCRSTIVWYSIFPSNCPPSSAAANGQAARRRRAVWTATSAPPSRVSFVFFNGQQWRTKQPLHPIQQRMAALIRNPTRCPSICLQSSPFASLLQHWPPLPPEPAVSSDRRRPLAPASVVAQPDTRPPPAPIDAPALIQLPDALAASMAHLPIFSHRPSAASVGQQTHLQQVYSSLFHRTISSHFPHSTPSAIHQTPRTPSAAAGDAPWPDPPDPALRCKLAAPISPICQQSGFSIQGRSIAHDPTRQQGPMASPFHLNTGHDPWPLPQIASTQTKPARR